MDDPRLSRLSDGQRTCLRMVLMHMSSKDIARQLDISPHTVDQRLKRAAKLLGVDSRVDAARILARAEGAEPYQPLVYQTPDIAAAPPSAAIVAHLDHEGADSLSGRAMREDQAAFDLGFRHSPDAMSLPLPIKGAKPDDLRPLQRIGWAVAIMFGVVLTFGIFVAGLEALSRLTGS